MQFFDELKRRNVIRLAIAYVAVSWLLIQVVETLFPIYGLSNAAIRLVVAIIAVGFVPAIVIAWVFELTPQGLKRDAEVDQDDPGKRASGKKLDRIILVILALGFGYLAFDKLVLDPARDVEMVEQAEQQARSDTLLESYGDRSIAVLPFVNMSPDPDQVFFSDGIAEELLNLFANTPGLRVSPRLSAFRFRDSQLNTREIARQLNVIYILEGSVRKVANQVRIAVKLIDSRSDTQLWSDTFDRTLDDVFVIQDEVAGAVVKQLRLTLLGETPKTRPVDVGAFPLFLQAQQILRLQQWDELSTAEELLNVALEIDPSYIAALTELYKVYWYQNTNTDRADMGKKLTETRAKVLALDPDNATFKAFDAFEKWVENDLVTAARLQQEAAEISPNDDDVLRLSARLALRLERFDLAIRIGEYLAERIPRELWVQFALADSYVAAGRVDDAIRHYGIISRLNPERGEAPWRSGLARLTSGDPVGAMKDFEREPHENYRLHGMVLALHDLGREEESAAALKELHAIDASEPGSSWIMGFARLYAWLGDADEAFRYLQLMVEEVPRRVIDPPDIPLYAKLHDDPRWLPLLESVGHSPEQLAGIEFNPRLPSDMQ